MVRAVAGRAVQKYFVGPLARNLTVRYIYVMANTTHTETIRTTTLRDGSIVLARPTGKYAGHAFTYCNLTQARRAAEKVGGDVIGRGPFFVAVAAR